MTAGISLEAEQIAIEHWRWMQNDGPSRNHSSIYMMLGRPAPDSFLGPDGVIQTMAEIWMEELADGRDA